VDELGQLLEEVGISRPATRWMIVAAHPDDEVIGAAFILRRARDLHVLHVTDGAPRDDALWSPRAPSSRSAYATLRSKESRAALALAGVPEDRIVCLGVADQQAAFSLVELTDRIRMAMEALEPDVVVVHAYEGGHPDHDAAAFAVHHAARWLAPRRPALLEMTSYHRRDGALRRGEFLPDPCPVAERSVVADGKRALIACFESQAEVLAGFDVERERYRRAPTYDFRVPPHEPPLHYETLGWPMTAQRFCALATAAGAQPC
jgi:LmbE family N-acetylglucosaminyl deacetylase